jgi:CheY-like chemotaxis protein
MTSATAARPLEILVADDDQEDVEMTLEALGQIPTPLNVHVVRDGEQAVEFLRRQGRYAEAADRPSPDLLLLDMQMPRMDGHEVLVEIRDDDRFKHLAVIALTGSLVQRVLHKSEHLPVDGYLTKPLKVAQLVEVLKSLRDRFSSEVSIPSVE